MILNWAIKPSILLHIIFFNVWQDITNLNYITLPKWFTRTAYWFSMTFWSKQLPLKGICRDTFTIAAIQSTLKTLSHVFSQYVCEANGWPILLSLLYLRGQPCSPKMLSPFGTFYLYRILLSVDFLKPFCAQDGFILFTLEIWREVTGFQKSQVFHPQFHFLIKINLVAFFFSSKKKSITVLCLHITVLWHQWQETHGLILAPFLPCFNC